MRATIAAPIAAALFTTAFLNRPVGAKDLPLARAYRHILDICLEETMRNKEAHIHLIGAGRTMLVHCGCVADIAMGKFSQAEIPAVLQGDLPASAVPMWQQTHEICINAGF